MTPLFKKLNYKNQSEILILNSPESFMSEINEIENFTDVKTNLKRIKSINFVLIFVLKKVEIDSVIRKIIIKLEEDALLWFAYPKGSSKNISVILTEILVGMYWGKMDLKELEL